MTRPEVTELLAELRALQAGQARLERVLAAVAEVLPMRFGSAIRRALNDNDRQEPAAGTTRR